MAQRRISLKEQAYEFGKIMAITISVVMAIFIGEEAIKRAKSLLKEGRYAFLCIFFLYSAFKPEFIQGIIVEIKNATAVLCVFIALYFQYLFFKPKEPCKACEERRERSMDDTYINYLKALVKTQGNVDKQ